MSGIFSTLFGNSVTTNAATAPTERKSSSESTQDEDLVRYVTSIHSDAPSIEHAKKHGLAITQIQWEDTGRFKDDLGNNASCWGSNISDFSLRPSGQKALCPVVRYPNYSDKRAHLPATRFQVSVGGAAEGLSTPVERIPLLTYLKTKIKDSTGNVVDLTADIDTTKGIMTSGQQCTLPLSSGKVAFNIHSYNYQTRTATDPGVLYVIAMSLGSSPQVSDGTTQQLYFNLNGKAANLEAKRLKEDRADRGVTTTGAMTSEELERNLLIVYTIPLKQKQQPCRLLSMDGYYSTLDDGCGNMSLSSSLYNMTPTSMSLQCCSTNSVYTSSSIGFESYTKERSRGSIRAVPSKANIHGIDDAMLGVGEPLFDFKNGPSTTTLERDPTKMIRATVQFYSATDSASIPEEVFASTKGKLDELYAKGTEIKQ